MVHLLAMVLLARNVDWVRRGTSLPMQGCALSCCIPQLFEVQVGKSENSKKEK